MWLVDSSPIVDNMIDLTNLTRVGLDIILLCVIVYQQLEVLTFKRLDFAVRFCLYLLLQLYTCGLKGLPLLIATSTYYVG